MIALTLAEITAAVGGDLRVAGDDTPETVVDGIVDTDSRTMGPGSVFVAKPGAETDGHRFVGAAVEAGAALAIVEHVVDVPVSQIVVPDAVVALGDLAREVVARVRSRGVLRIIGITGSNGKTTTKNFLARILSDEGETVAPVNSFNNEVGAPVTMLRVTENTRFLVSEFGAAAPGSIARLAGLVEPDVAVVLMVGMAHAGGFGGIEETAKAKAELVAAAATQGTAVLNFDDSRVAAMQELATSRGLRVVGFGQSTAADVRAHDIVVSASGTTCEIEAGDERIPLRLRVLGAHHITNALAAIAAARVLGVTLADAVARLETVEIAERWRMQPMGKGS